MLMLKNSRRILDPTKIQNMALLAELVVLVVLAEMVVVAVLLIN